MMGYVHKEIASPFITIQKDEGIQPATILLHFLFTLSQSLSHNHIDYLQYNTIPYAVVLQCFYFIGEIPWENTTGNPIPWVRKTVGQQTVRLLSSQCSYKGISHCHEIISHTHIALTSTHKDIFLMAIGLFVNKN